MKKIGCVVKGYPRLSETFIAQELAILEQAGLEIVIYSLRYPYDHTTHPVHSEIRARVHYLPEYLYQSPLRVLAALFRALFKRKFYRLLPVFLRDLRRDLTSNRVRRFGQALVLDREIDPDCEWLYVHFLHTPASVTRYCSYLNGLPWSCSAHAKDIWTTPDWEIREKLDDMRWLVTCTRTNAKHLESLDNGNGKVSLLYHGLDLGRFSDMHKDRVPVGSLEPPIRILSVGRAVEKKGYDILLRALALVPENIEWEFHHIGGGELHRELGRLAEELGISGRVTWLGPRSQGEVVESYRSAHMFVLASRIGKDGDRDGLPNVLMEAMIHGLPCIATRVSGIPELILDGVNGLLVPSGDETSLASAMEKLAVSSGLREQFGREGYKTVCEQFSLDENVKPLLERFLV